MTVESVSSIGVVPGVDPGGLWGPEAPSRNVSEKPKEQCIGIKHPKCIISQYFMSTYIFQGVAPTIPRGGSRGSLGSRDPPPEIYQGSQKNDVLV